LPVKITLVPSSVGTSAAGSRHFLTSYLINDTVALDAGSLGFYREAPDQTRIKHLLLTHTHIDHIASLPIFLENAFEGRPDCVTVYATAEVLDTLRRDIFNDRVWPDFFSLSRPAAPFLHVSELKPRVTVEFAGLRVTPVPVSHVVPTVGYIVEDANGAVVFPSDTGPTEEIWERASALTNLKAVFLEATFPDELGWLADVSKHLTPATFAGELRKLHQPAKVIVVHIKARYHMQVVAQIEALGLPNVSIGVAEHAYSF
jgi:ribonuclease BN (tRNA processing enzyme)